MEARSPIFANREKERKEIMVCKLELDTYAERSRTLITCANWNVYSLITNIWDDDSSWILNVCSTEEEKLFDVLAFKMDLLEYGIPYFTTMKNQGGYRLTTMSNWRIILHLTVLEATAGIPTSTGVTTYVNTKLWKLEAGSKKKSARFAPGPSTTFTSWKAVVGRMSLTGWPV